MEKETKLRCQKTLDDNNWQTYFSLIPNRRFYVRKLFKNFDNDYWYGLNIVFEKDGIVIELGGKKAKISRDELNAIVELLIHLRSTNFDVL